MTLADLLFDASLDPERLAVHAAGMSWTVAQARDSAEQLAGILRAHGLGTAAAVGVMLPNSPEAVAALFGVMRAGAVYVPVNPRATAREIENIVAAAGISLFITGPEPRSDVLPALPILRHDHGGAWSVPDRAAEPARRYDAAVAIVCFTSGTTSAPKPVHLRHEAFVDLIDRVLLSLRRGHAAARPAAPMPNLVVMSMALFAGIYNVLFAFRVGAPVVLMEKFDTVEFASLVRRFGIRSVVLPPAAMVMLADDENLADLAPLRIVRSGTAPLPASQARRFHERFGVVVLNSYGQSELGGEIVGWNLDDARQFFEAKAGAVGRPNPGVELRIVDEGGGPAEPDESGELLVRTPSLAAGNLADLADRIVGDGWFRTGDLGRIDQDGFLWISGRVTDLINRGGLKVVPEEVEDVLRVHPALADVAVAGVPDERLGEVPWAFVVYRPGAAATSAELRAWCRGRLLPFKIPVGFRSIRQLPRNDIGKVLRRELISYAQRSGREATG